MNAKKFFVGAASLLVSYALLAATAPVEDAEWVAKGWLKDNAQAFGALGAALSVNAEKGDAGETLWYWVVFEKGAVVVAPDTEIEPVIAVIPGCDGSLPEGHPMRVLLRTDMAKRLAYAKSLQAPSRPSRLLGVSSASQTGTTSTTLSKTATKWARLKSRGNSSHPLPRLLQAANDDKRPATVVKWLDGWNDVDASITCWTQEDPFNRYTPLSGGGLPMPSVVGCVATAGASVLHYFQDSGCEAGLLGTCTVDRRFVVGPDGQETVVGVTNLYTMGGPYDWSSLAKVKELGAQAAENANLAEPGLDLLLEGLGADNLLLLLDGQELPDPSVVDAEMLELLKLWVETLEDEDKQLARDYIAAQAAAGEIYGRVSYDVGVLSHMNYSALSSGAYCFDLAIALHRYFSLKSARYVNANGANRGNGDPIESRYFDRLVYNQIRAGSPVVLGISSSTGGAGHAVVACGYGFDSDETDYTYVFCGWAGEGDAWYALPFIDTKATAGDANASYDCIGDIVTMLSTNVCSVPLVGRVVDRDGKAVTNAVLRLADGSTTLTDENGYWAFRVNPNLTRSVVYDPAGDSHVFDIGTAAVTPNYFIDEYGTTKDAVAAADLAAALPPAMELTIDRAAVDNDMTLFGEYVEAAKKALAEGKLLYVIGGTDESAVEALKTEFRAFSNETFQASHVFWQVDSGRYGTLADLPLVCGAVDPRVFDPSKRLTTENGGWTNGFWTVEAWTNENRKAVSCELIGPASLLTDPVQSGRYVLNVTYADDKTLPLNVAFADWSVDDSSRASVALGYLTPKADGEVKLSASVTLWGETIAGEKTVALRGGNCVIVGASRTNTCIVAVNDDANVVAVARQIAQNSDCTPPYNRYGDDPEMIEMAFGSVYTLRSPATYEQKDKYVFRCVGLQLNDVTVTNFEADAAGELAYDYTVDAAETRVGWLWKTERCYVDLNRLGSAHLDTASGYFDAGSNVVVSVSPDSGIRTNQEWIAVWSGCSVAEAGVSNATIAVDRPRNVSAYVVHLSDDATTNLLKVVETNGLVVAKGYRIDLMAVNESPYGEGTTYDIRVVRDDSPDPEIVEPGPIAFESIEKVEGEWVLVATNATQWCEYSLVSGTTLATNTWPEAVWTQWKEPTGPITNRVPVVADEPVRFWIIRARPGEKPAE